MACAAKQVPSIPQETGLQSYPFVQVEIRVTNRQGVAVEPFQITVENPAMGERMVRPNQTFFEDELEPGKYIITIEAQGYKPTTTFVILKPHHATYKQTLILQ